MLACPAEEVLLAARRRPLWTCPKCGNRFVTRNLSHSCVRWPLARHFAGRPRAWALYRALLAAIRAIGPVRVVSSRTRIAFMTRVRFAAVGVRVDGLRGHLWLPSRVDAWRLGRVERLGARAFVHHFALRAPGEIDAAFRRHLRASYAVGRQEHLPPPVSRGRAAP